MDLIVGNFVSSLLAALRQAHTAERVHTLLACAHAHQAATNQIEKNRIATLANRKLKDLANRKLRDLE